MVIAQIAENDIVLWADAIPSNPASSRRNIFSIGQNLVALHDGVDTWLPTVGPLLQQPGLSTLPVDQLAARLNQNLQGITGTVQADLGLIVGGFMTDGSPALFGLHSARNFGSLRFSPSVIGGLPASIWGYLGSALQAIPHSRGNTIDLLVMAGEFYHDVILSRFRGGPKGSAVAVLTAGQGLSWLTDDEVESARVRNARRLITLHSIVGGLFLDLKR